MGKRGPQPTKRLPDAEAVEQSLIVKNEKSLSDADQAASDAMQAALRKRNERQEKARDSLSEIVEDSVEVVKKAQALPPSLGEDEKRGWDVKLKAAFGNLEMNGLRSRNHEGAIQPVIINVTNIQVNRMTKAVERLGVQ